MEIHEILTTDIARVGPEMSLVDAAKLMRRKNISSIIVVKENNIVGILSERDFIHLIATLKDPRKLSVSDVMSSPVITSDINTSLADILHLMNDRGIRRIPITENGRLVGIITQSDLARALRKTHARVEPTIEDHLVTSPMKHILKPGKTYLFMENRPQKSIQIFVELVRHGMAGLMITREDPQELKSSWKLEKTPVLWLTNTAPEGDYIGSHDVQGISILVGNFIAKAPNSVILLDGVSYLVTQNKFDTILNLLQNLHDKALSLGAILIFSINSKTLKSQELELLKQEADKII
jgi:predicted transcriptional regulator